MKYFDTDDAFKQAMHAGFTMMFTKSKDDFNKAMAERLTKHMTILNKKFGIVKRGCNK